MSGGDSPVGVSLQTPLDHPIPCELGQNPLAATLTHPVRLLGMVAQPGEWLLQRGRIRRLDDEPGLAVADDLGHPSGPGADARPAACHPLEQRLSEQLGDARLAAVAVAVL